MHTVKVLGDYIDGRFRRPRGAQSKIVSRDPGDTGYRIGSFSVYPGHVDAAIDAARAASDEWRKMDLSERADILRKFAAEVVNQREALTETIAICRNYQYFHHKESITMRHNHNIDDPPRAFNFVLFISFAVNY